MKKLYLILVAIVCLLVVFAFGVENISSNLSNLSSEILPDINTTDFLNETAIVNVTEEIVETPIFEEVSDSLKESDKIVETKLDKILKKERLDKLSKDLQKIDVNDTVKVIIQKSGELQYKEIDGQEIIDELNKSSVVKIWPDRELQLFLDKSVPLIGAQTLWNQGYSGQNVRVAILDTGIDFDHEMFANTSIISADFTGSGSAQDGHGHGTHVAGIIAGHANYTGVAPNVTLLIGKVLTDGGYGQLSWLIDAINWAVSQNASVISLSLGATYTDAPEDLLSAPEVLAVENAIANGVTVVIASGNCRMGCGSFTGVTTPGFARNAITVGAVNNSLSLAPFSSGAEIADYIKPDVVAPGVGICSSVVDGYACYSGTSMATPHIAGIVALMLSRNNSLSPSAIKSMLVDASIDLGDVGADTSYGNGFVNASAIDFGMTFNEIISYADVTQNTTSITVTGVFNVVDNAILEIYLNNNLVEEQNYTSSFVYSFSPSVGNYSIHITAHHDNNTQTYTKYLEIKKVSLFASSVVSGYNSSLYLRVFNDEYMSTDVSLLTEEFGSYYEQNQSDSFIGYKVFTFPVYFAVPGKHNVAVTINGETFTDAVSVKYPNLVQSIDQIRVRVR